MKADTEEAKRQFTKAYQDMLNIVNSIHPKGVSFQPVISEKGVDIVLDRVDEVELTPRS
tara:strand:- start:523 stop:699 length:177 start_codon:yes stop_codon:yes gene_type:complete